MKIQSNIELKSAALTRLQAHCLCAKIEGDIVYLPAGYFPHGLRIALTAEGYNRAEAKLEQIWKESFL